MVVTVFCWPCIVVHAVTAACTQSTHALRTELHQIASVQNLLKTGEWSPKHVEALTPNKQTKKSVLSSWCWFINVPWCTVNKTQCLLHIPCALTLEWAAVQHRGRSSAHSVLGKTALYESLWEKHGLWAVTWSHQLHTSLYSKHLRSARVADAATFHGGWVSDRPRLCALF
jgi:hypothetical protein